MGKQITSGKIRVFSTWQKKENNAVQTKGSGAFEEKLRLDTLPVTTGRYRIKWNAEMRLQAGNTSLPKIRIQLDAVVIAVKTFKSPDQEWDSYSGWDIMFFNEGDTPSITIEIKRVGGTDIIELRRAKVSIELMGSD